MSETPARQAVEEAADTLGEALLKVADDPTAMGYEPLAKATMLAGLRSLARTDPGEERVARVAEAIYAAMHDGSRDTWAQLDATQRDFWYRIARRAVGAADESAAEAVGAV
jgi:hypothetical protein